jgi:hypothetical protein
MCFTHRVHPRAGLVRGRAFLVLFLCWLGGGVPTVVAVRGQRARLFELFKLLMQDFRLGQVRRFFARQFLADQ